MNRSFIIILVVLIALLILGYPRVVKFYQSDDCLDSGGSWNYSSNNCKFSMGDENLVDHLSEVNWNMLSNDPDSFHGDTILISGYYICVFENVSINSGSNKIWVELSNSFDTTIIDFEDRINGRDVQIFGTFNSKDKGHLGLFLGTIDQTFYVTTK